MATIKDVAKEAGVTATTVSRVLNDRGYIGRETRRKVHAAMKKLGYRPNEIARALSKSRTDLLGVVVPSLLHPFFSTCIHFFEHYAWESGYKLLVCNSERNAEKERAHIEMLRSNRVSGIILCTRGGGSAEQVQDFPVVSLERSISETIPAIICDNYRGGELATRLLLDHGCRHPVMVGGDPGLALPADDRKRAFCDMCSIAGIEPVTVATDERQFVTRDYRKTIGELLASRPETDGIFASGDVIASQVLQVCREQGIAVPDALQVVGFDDVELASLVVPTLTTIRQPLEEMCRLAVGLVLQKSRGEAVPFRTMLPVSLIKRGSTRIR